MHRCVPGWTGNYESVEVHLHVAESATPRCFKPRPLAYALQGPVVREIEWLQELISLVSVTHSAWAASIVPIVKGDGSIRIWGDYKVTANQVSKLDNYPIPKMKTCSPKLERSEVHKTGFKPCISTVPIRRWES